MDIGLIQYAENEQYSLIRSIKIVAIKTAVNQLNKPNRGQMLAVEC